MHFKRYIWNYMRYKWDINTRKLVEVVEVKKTKAVIPILDYRKLARENPEATGWFVGCHVHHIDHNRSNNDLANLRCMTRFEHLSMHGRLRSRRKGYKRATGLMFKWNGYRLVPKS